uniref:Uncharacterized protein n=1 Tax=Romanomermis culicivorax TaxID=13658 RepID=A0A915HJH5_ROMCU
MSINYTGTKTIYITERIHEYSTENCVKCSQICCQRQPESKYSLSKRRFQEKSAVISSPVCDWSQRRIFSVLPRSALLSGYFARFFGCHNVIDSSEISDNSQKEVKTIYITEKIKDSRMAQDDPNLEKTVLPSHKEQPQEEELLMSFGRIFLQISSLYSLVYLFYMSSYI